MQDRYQDLNKPLRVLLLASPVIIAFLVVMIQFLFNVVIIP